MIFNSAAIFFGYYKLIELNNLNYIMPNRVELYTYDYAKNYSQNKEVAIGPYTEVVNYLNKNFPLIDFNAGHDLNLQNLDYLLNKINNIKEVSIGHALVCDTLEYGLETTVKKYLEIINK